MRATAPLGAGLRGVREPPRAREPVSRVLYPAARRRGMAAIYLGAPLPTRSCGATRGTGRTPLTPPISPCFGWGLPSFRHRCRNGELLPRLFTLAGADALSARRYVSVALSVGSPRPAVSGHPVRRSSDFPPRFLGATARLPRSDNYSAFRGDDAGAKTAADRIPPHRHDHTPSVPSATASTARVGPVSTA